MKRLKEILTDCLLIVPYTVIWLIVLASATVIVMWQRTRDIYQKIDQRRQHG